MIKKYRKKPVVIEAVEWTGKNFKEVLDFVSETEGDNARSLLAFHQNDLHIKTLEGEHKAIISDFIIRGVHDEYYPCKNDIFYETYEEV